MAQAGATDSVISIQTQVMRLPAGGAKIANFAGANKQKAHDNGNRERKHNNRHLRERPLGAMVSPLEPGYDRLIGAIFDTMKTAYELNEG